MGMHCTVTNIRSSRVLRRIMEEIWQSMSVPLRALAENRALGDQWNDEMSMFFPSWLPVLLLRAGRRRVESFFP